MIILITAFTGGVIRRLSGFGGALVMTPVFIWLMPLSNVIGLVMTAEFIGGCILATSWKLPASEYSRSLRILFIAFLITPLGIYLGSYLPSVFTKILLNSTTLLFALYVLKRPLFQIKMRPKLDYLIGAICGFLLGSTGVGGPPMVLYANASAMSIDVTKALVSIVITGFSLIAAVQIFFMSEPRGWLNLLPQILFSYLLGIILGKYIPYIHSLKEQTQKTLCIYFLIVSSVFNLVLVMMKFIFNITF